MLKVLWMKKLEQTKCFHQRMFNIIPSSVSKISYNKQSNENTPWCLPGGTVIKTDTNFKAHQLHSNINSTGHGRWKWTWLEGKYETYTTYIYAYYPCANKSGLSTTWNQHMPYFRDKSIQESHHRNNFDNDLIDFLKQVLRRGDNMFLGIDMNEDARISKLAKRLKLLGQRPVSLYASIDITTGQN